MAKKKSTLSRDGTQPRNSLNLTKTGENTNSSCRPSEIDANLILQNDPSFFLHALVEQLVKSQSRNGCLSKQRMPTSRSFERDSPDNNVLIARMNEGCENTGKQNEADEDEERDNTRRVLDAIKQVGDALGVITVASGDNAAIPERSAMECIGGNSSDGKINPKRTVVSYFKEHYHNKVPAWETDIIDDDDDEEEEEENSSETDDCASDLDCDLPRYENIFERVAEGNPRQRSATIERYRDDARCSVPNCCMENSVNRGSKEHVLACATAAITSKLAPSTVGFFDGKGTQSDRKRHKRARHHRTQSMQRTPGRRIKETLVEDARIRGGGRRSTYFKYPLHPNTSDTTQTVTTKISPVSADTLDNNPNFSKSNLTSPRTPSLQLSLDNFGLLVKRNLVATLISVYILVSLTVILVLILPYLFKNSPSATREVGPPLIVLDLPTIIPHEPFSPNDKKSPEDRTQNGGAGVSRGTQTGSPGNPSKQVASNNSALRSLEFSSTPKPSQSASLSTSSSHQRSSEESHKSTERVGATEPSSDLRSNENKRRETRVGNQTEPQFVANNRTGSLREIYYRKLWSVVHNQQCQPMKVSFCSRSLETMYNALSPTTSFTSSKSASGYEKTLLPNQFTLTRQSQVDILLQGYEPIIDIKCYPLMPLFLCSIYAPKCIPVNQSEVDSWHNHQRIPLESLHMITRGAGEPVKTGSETNTIEFPDQLNRTSLKSGPANGQTTKGVMPPPNKNYARLVPPCRSLCIGMIMKLIFESILF